MLASVVLDWEIEYGKLAVNLYGFTITRTSSLLPSCEVAEIDVFFLVCNRCNVVLVAHPLLCRGSILYAFESCSINARGYVGHVLPVRGCADILTSVVQRILAVAMVYFNAGVRYA